MLKTILTLSFAVLGGIAASAADIYLAGDSIQCNYPDKKAPQQGWGHELQSFCVDGVKVVNLAQGGRSIKSFRDDKKWEELLAQVKEGDFVVISFGINDGNKKDKKRYANHRDAFPELLKLCVAEVLAKKANPILTTPSCRWAFDKEAKKIYNGSASAYSGAIRAVGESEKVPVIDLNRISVGKLLAAGPDATKKYYMISAWGKDNLHLTVEGAQTYATWFVEQAKEQKLPIAACFK